MQVHSSAQLWGENPTRGWHVHCWQDANKVWSRLQRSFADMLCSAIFYALSEIMTDIGLLEEGLQDERRHLSPAPGAESMESLCITVKNAAMQQMKGG